MKDRYIVKRNGCIIGIFDSLASAREYIGTQHPKATYNSMLVWESELLLASGHSVSEISSAYDNAIASETTLGTLGISTLVTNYKIKSY